MSEERCWWPIGHRDKHNCSCACNLARGHRGYHKCEVQTAVSDTPTEQECICSRFRDTGGYRIANLTCPVHGMEGTDPGDGPWESDTPTDTPEAPEETT